MYLQIVKRVANFRVGGDVEKQELSHKLYVLIYYYSSTSTWVSKLNYNVTLEISSIEIIKHDMKR